MILSVINMIRARYQLNRVHYTQEHAHAACCVWEAMIEYRRKMPALDKAWHDEGTSAMRDLAVILAGPINEAWHAVSDEFDSPFDWEFVPLAIEYIDWQNGTTLCDAESMGRCVLNRYNERESSS